ncbi:hypothetical protein HK405_009285 [Cladochytrium tenue]|nr:hypothetical protein HK405_009285 [Cladochytrium tenue]
MPVADGSNGAATTKPPIWTPRRRLVAAVALAAILIVAAIVAALAVVLPRRPHSSLALPTSVPPASAYTSQVTRSGLASAYVAGSNVGRYSNASTGTAGSGVAAIHAALMPQTGKVAFLERWDVHGTAATLASGAVAWSVEYDYSTDTFRPLTLNTNVFCAGGMVLPDGRLAVIGGAENRSDDTVGALANGMRGVRLLAPSGSPGSSGSADWIDPPNPSALLDPRWYPSVVTLPDGRLLVVGGSNYGVEFNADWSNTPTFEFLPRAAGVSESSPMQFLWDTLPDNLYPAMFVLPSGRVFMFASYKAVLLDPDNGYNPLPMLQFVAGSASPVLSGNSSDTSTTSAASMTCVDESSDSTHLTLSSCVYLDAGSANTTSLVTSSQAFAFLKSDLSSNGLILSTTSGLCWATTGSISSQITLDYCDPSNSTQSFSLTTAKIVHSSSGLCVSATSNLALALASYPWTAASVMLPLDPADDYAPQILICGGSQLECGWNCLTYDCQQACQGTNASTLNSCGLINPEKPWAAADSEDASLGLAAWNMDDIMPMGRVMGDLVNLPDGSVLLLNGAGAGMAGWDKGREPTFQALLYQRYGEAGQRWQALDTSTIPRLYHSSAMLLPDGRVMVAGSAPNDPTSFTEQSATPPAFATEHRVEYFLPPYLTSGAPRPSIDQLSPTAWPAYNATAAAVVSNLDVAGTCPLGPAAVDFALLHTGFRTHSTGHGQRMIWLLKSVVTTGSGNSSASFGLLSPPSPEVAPPGWYLLFAVCGGIPSEGKWVQVGGDPAGFASYSV